VEAMKKVRTDVKLLITGDGYLRAQIEEQIQKNNMAARIEVRSPVWGEPFEQLLKGARFIVVPSEWYDNGVLVPYYAFGHGKPVIASRIHGLIEEVDHEVNGLLFETGNPASLAEAIDRLCDDNNLWTKLSTNARRKALTQLNAEKHYQHLIEIIDGVIEEKHMSPAKKYEVMANSPGA
jgi:glycosyltransferase involved in cell wall biosynthesis